MNPKFHILAGAAIAACLSLSALAQSEPSHERFGADKTVTPMIFFQIENFNGDVLGRINDLGIDLSNGRIVEVLVGYDQFLGMGGKIVAIPPAALSLDPMKDFYRVNMSVDAFKNAPTIDLSKWQDEGRSVRVAAAYHYFGQEPYFLQEGETANASDSRPKVSLGYMERSSRIIDMPVGNFQNEPFGKVASMSLDILKGRILSVVVLAPGNFKTESVIPAMALSFNATRDALLLDDSKDEFADEPRFVLTPGSNGNDLGTSREESYMGPRTSLPLVQGSTHRDNDRTARIVRDIRTANIDESNVEVGTIDGRVTLRGWVETDAERTQIGAIAIAASRLELVDNQIVVGKPVTNNP